MSVLVVDKMREFVENLNLECKVLSFSDDGENTTLIVENVFHIRAMPESSIRNVYIDGSPYGVIEVDYKSDTVTVKGVLTDASTYKVPNPFYWQGSLISVANEIKLLDDSQKLPMFYHNDIIREKLPKKPSSFLTIANTEIAFADVYSNDWTRQEHYDNLIRPLYKLADFVRGKIDSNKCFRTGSDISQRTVPKWGEVSRKGTMQKTFNEYLDAIEWVFDLEICDCN